MAERAKPQCQHSHWSGSGQMQCVLVAGHVGERHLLADSDIKGREFQCDHIEGGHS